jgi:N-acyl-D-aspartate/D-glutamate deacylase
VPSVVASPAETEALIMAVAAAGRGIVHVAPGDNFEWIYDLAPRYGRTFTWSAILAYPDDLPRPVTWRDKLGRHLEGRRAGLDVHVQVTSRVLTFSFTMENPLTLYGFPSIAALDRGDPAARAACFRDAAWRARARAEMDRPGLSWTRMTVAETTQPGVAGRSIADLAAERGVHPLDAILDVALADVLATRFQVVAANGDDAAVARLLTGDGCILGLSDAGAHIGQLCDAVMPLDYLSRWVRDRTLVPVEAGIHKLTGELAAMLGLTDRGVLRPGAWADVVVLEWDELGTGPLRRVRDLPGGEERLVADEPTGLRHVVVNGEPIRVAHESRRPDRLPGMVLGPKRYDR